jgi:hypothetical protein
VSVVLWLAFMSLLAVYIEATDSWAFLTSVALFLGLAFAAQLEAVRAGVAAPRLESD